MTSGTGRETPDHPPPLLNPPQSGHTGGGEFSVEFWLLIVGVALFLVGVYAVYKFHAKKVNSKTESEETVLNDINMGDTRLSRLLKYVWARMGVAFLDWHLFICSLLLGIFN
jgi:hypothetical protein